MVANNRVWIIGGVLVIVLVAALGLLLGVKPQIDAAFTADADRSNVELLNVAAENELVTLRTEFAELDQLKSELAELQESVPALSSIGELTTQLDAAQTTHGVLITNVAVSDAVRFVPTAEVAGQVPASITADNFTVIPIVVTIKGDPTAMFDYIHSVQAGKRLMLIKGLTVSEENTIDIAANVYVLSPPGESAVEATPETTATDTGEPVN
jgi:Tfp pilus assembly protein PilO